MGKPQKQLDVYQDALRALRTALGTRIRELRVAQNWNQDELADNAHVHRTFIGSVERGQANCSFHALVMIARAFRVTVSELLKGIETGEAIPGKDIDLGTRLTPANIRRTLDLIATLERECVIQQRTTSALKKHVEKLQKVV